jgi:hypothetical protein
MTLVEDMYQEIAELAKKRSRDIESTLENFQQDAQESSQQCNSQSNKKQRTSSPVYNQDFTNESSYQQLASNSLPMPPVRFSPSSRTNSMKSMNSMNSMNDYRGGKTNRRKRTMKKTMKRKTMKKRRKQSRK